MIRLNAAMNFAPVAPSMIRWSQLIVNRIRRPGDDCAVLDHRLVAYRSDCEDGALGWIDHCGELFDANMPRLLIEKVPFVISSGWSFIVSCARGELAHLVRDLRNALAIRIANHRRHQPFVDGDCYRNVDDLVVLDLFAHPGRIHLGNPA